MEARNFKLSAEGNLGISACRDLVSRAEKFGRFVVAVAASLLLAALVLALFAPAGRENLALGVIVVLVIVASALAGFGVVRFKAFGVEFSGKTGGGSPRLPRGKKPIENK